MKNYLITAAAAAAALTLAGCGDKNENATVAANAYDPDTANAPLASPTTSAQDFVNAAAASDSFEIESSKLAATNGASAAVKDFATKMIAAHTDSTQKLKATLATAAPQIVPDATMSADQQQMLDALRQAKGDAFDALYIADQQAAHQSTLDVLRGYAASGDVAALKEFANGLVPIVTAHLNMANGMKP